MGIRRAKNRAKRLSKLQKYGLNKRSLAQKMIKTGKINKDKIRLDMDDLE